MKITGARTTLYEVKLSHKMGDANSPGGRSTAGHLAVEVATDDREEPARRWDYRGLRLVSESVKAVVATGITGAMQVAHMAHAFELTIATINCPANFMAHLAAALPNHLAMEVVDPGREPCCTFNSHIEDGWIQLGDRPGLGIEIDEATLARIEVKQPPLRPGMPFPRREGAGLYEVPPTPDVVVRERRRTGPA